MSDQENTEIKKENFFSNFLKNNKMKLIILFIIIILILSVTFFLNFKKERDNTRISEIFVKAEILIKKNKKDEAKELFKEIVLSKNPFYSPMALTEIIEHELSNIEEIKNYYDKVISIRSLDKDKKDLFKLKKIISTSNFATQEEVVNQVEKLIEDETIWKNVALKFLVNYMEVQHMH